MKWWRPAKTFATLVGQAVALTVATVFVGLLLTTLQNLYKGDLVATPGQTTDGVATVGECQRTGPVGLSGLGYWWQCRIHVELADKRSADAVVGHSIVTPGDRAAPVKVVERCRGEDRTSCSYARPGNFGLALLVRAVYLLKLTLLAIGGTAILVVLAAMVMMPFARFGKTPAESEALPVLRPDIDGKAVQPGSGVLLLDLAYTKTGKSFYREIIPLLSIDQQAEREIPWGLNTVVLPVGDHRVEIWIPFKPFKWGRVSQSLSIADQLVTVGRYKAPDNPAKYGSITVSTQPLHPDADQA